MLAPEPAIEHVLNYARERIASIIEERGLSVHSVNVRSRISPGGLKNFLEDGTYDIGLRRLAQVAETLHVDLHSLIPAGIPGAQRIPKRRGVRKKKRAKARRKSRAVAPEAHSDVDAA